jgi:hypothetical protein
MSLFIACRLGPAVEAGPRPANTARLGSRPNSRRLGRRSGPASPPAWAQSSPAGPGTPQPSISDQRLRITPPKSLVYIRQMTLKTLTPLHFPPPHPQLSTAPAAAGLLLPRGRRPRRRRLAAPPSQKKNPQAAPFFPFL